MTNLQVLPVPFEITEIDSPYFGEEDVLGIQTELIDAGLIDHVTDQNRDLADPVFLGKALDRLIDMAIAQILEYPAEMLFGNSDGSFLRDFEQAIRYVKQPKN